MKVYSSDKFNVSTRCEQVYHGIIFVTDKDTGWQYQFKAHNSWISDLTILPNNYLLTRSTDNTVALSNVERGEVEYTIKLEVPITVAHYVWPAILVAGDSQGFITVVNILAEAFNAQSDIEVSEIIHQFDTQLGSVKAIKDMAEEDFIFTTVHEDGEATWNLNDSIQGYMNEIDPNWDKEEYY